MVDYEKFFKPLRKEKQGGSLATFSEYFENSTVYGIDIVTGPYESHKEELISNGRDVIWKKLKYIRQIRQIKIH